MKSRHSLEAAERETIISWSDEDTDKMTYIYTSQQAMIRKLLKSKDFQLKEKHISKDYTCYPEPLAIEGYLPRKFITIRSKMREKRELTEDQKNVLRERLKKARKK